MLPSRLSLLASLLILLVLCRVASAQNGPDEYAFIEAEKQQLHLNDRTQGRWYTEYYKITYLGSTPSLLNASGYLTARVTDENGQAKSQGGYFYIKNFSSNYPAYFGLSSVLNNRVGPGASQLVPLSIYVSKNDPRPMEVELKVHFYRPLNAGPAPAVVPAPAPTPQPSAPQPKFVYKPAARCTSDVNSSSFPYLNGNWSGSMSFQGTGAVDLSVANGAPRLVFHGHQGDTILNGAISQNGKAQLNWGGSKGGDMTMNFRFTDNCDGLEGDGEYTSSVGAPGVTPFTFKLRRVGPRPSVGFGGGISIAPTQPALQTNSQTGSNSTFNCTLAVLQGNPGACLNTPTQPSNVSTQPPHVEDPDTRDQVAPGGDWTDAVAEKYGLVNGRGGRWLIGTYVVDCSGSQRLADDTYLVGDITDENGKWLCIGSFLRIKNLSSTYPAFFGIGTQLSQAVIPLSTASADYPHYRTKTDKSWTKIEITVKYWRPY
jgi:hypothetical protein